MRSFANFLHAVSWGYHWRHPHSVHPLKMTSQRSLLTKPRCRPAREFAGGGSELWRPRLQTRHLLMTYFGHPLRQAYVRLGCQAGGGGGQESLRSQPPHECTLTGRGSWVYPSGQGSRVRPGRGRRCAPASPLAARAVRLRLALRARGSRYVLAARVTRSQLGLRPRGALNPISNPTLP